MAAAIANPVQQLVKAVAMPVLGHAARRYVAGTALADAAALAQRAADSGLRSTLCYWNDGSEDPAIVASEYMGIVRHIGRSDLDGALALKVPAVWDQQDKIDPIVAEARARGVPVILDSHAPDQADANLQVIERLGGSGLGLAIPGRWRRSLADADRAIAAGARIRVVKGEWADPDWPDADLGEAYLRLISHIAGRARFVGIATHDAALSAQAMQILADAGTPFEQEFVFPLPIASARREGHRFGAAARLYIPFGEAWLPYSMKRAFRNPKTFYWLTRDLIVGKRFELA